MRVRQSVIFSVEDSENNEIIVQILLVTTLHHACFTAPLCLACGASFSD